MPWVGLRCTLDGGMTVLPADDPSFGCVPNVNLAPECPVGITQSCAASSLGQAEAVDGLLARAPREHGNLAKPIREFARPESCVRQIGNRLPVLISGGLGLAGVVHCHEDGASLEQYGREVVAEEF